MDQKSFGLFFERNPIPLYLTDRKTLRIVAVNAAALKLYGYSRGEMLGMKATQIRPRKEVPAFLKAVRTMPAYGVRVVVPGVWKHVRKDGRIVTVAINATRIPFSGMDCVLASVQDVSELVELRSEMTEFREFWRGIIEDAPDYIWTLDPKGTILSINRVHVQLTRDRVVGSSVWAWFLNAEDKNAFKHALRMVFEKGQSSTVSCEFNFPEGALTFENRLAPVREAGKVKAAVIVSTDVTLRRKVEREFEESRLLLNSIFRSAPDFMIVIDRKGVISFINRMDTPGDVVGKTIYELASPHSRAEMRRAVKTVFTQRKEADYEADSVYADGTTIRWRARVGPMVENGRVVSAILIARDITEEYNAARELERAQTRFRGIFEHSREGMNFVARDGSFMEVNPAMCRMLGYTREELRRMKFHELTPPEWRDSDEVAWKQIERTKEPYEFEKEYLRKDGSRVPISLTAFLIPGSDGGGASIVRDNTERKRLEREILQTGAREQSQLGRELHDSLGQELTGISLLAQSLAKSLDASGGAHAESARRIAETARIAVEEVRALAAGLMPAELLPNGLPAALEALRARAERLFGLRAELRCPERLERLEDVSLIHLYRIAQEAVTNAAKHSKAKKVRISLAVRRGRLELSVVDDGIGLRGDGEGLGLKIMRHRALTLGGTFAARRRKQGGTEIVCSIPFVL